MGECTLTSIIRKSHDEAEEDKKYDFNGRHNKQGLDDFVEVPSEILEEMNRIDRFEH